MMSKEELTTLISALRFNANILNEKLGEQENILGELLELQETIAVQLNTLEEEMENIDIIDNDKKLDDEEDITHLRAGDYVSLPNSKARYNLFQILETEDKQFFKLDVGKSMIVGDKYNSIDKLIDSLVNENEGIDYDDLYFYYTDKDNPEHIGEGKYLLFDNEDEDYEVIVNYNKDEDFYEVLCAGWDTPFYTKCFDSLDELELQLRKDYSLIKSLRYSTH